MLKATLEQRAADNRVMMMNPKDMDPLALEYWEMECQEIMRRKKAEFLAAMAEAAEDDTPPPPQAKDDTPPPPTTDQEPGSDGILTQEDEGNHNVMEGGDEDVVGDDLDNNGVV